MPEPVHVFDPLTPTVFHEPWWLEIVTGGKYRVVEVKGDNDRIAGRLPYYLERDWGITRGVMPPLTHFLGPAVDEGEGGPDTKFARKLAITRELIAKLPAASSYQFKCHYGVKDAIAFQREKFLTAVQFTHEIMPKPEAELWKGMQHKRRSAITRVRKVLRPVEASDSGALDRFMRDNLSAYGLKSYYSMNICNSLVKASLERGCGRVVFANDEQGNPASAIFCVWDQHSYYLFLTARRPSTFRGSLTILVWEAMRDAAQRNLVFDMDGVSTDESVSFFTGFGATVTPRYIVTRENKSMRVLRAVQQIFKPINYYC